MEELKIITRAHVGDQLLAPVCKCGKHFVFHKADRENLEAHVACPDHLAGEDGHEGWSVPLHLTAEWGNLPDLYLLVHAKRYAGIPCMLKGHVRDVALKLAKFARSKAKGRMTDSYIRTYADMFEAALRLDAEKPETVELQLEAFASEFEVGINAGHSMRVVVPATIIDVYDEPVEFEFWDMKKAPRPRPGAAIRGKSNVGG